MLISGEIFSATNWVCILTESRYHYIEHRRTKFSSVKKRYASLSAWS